MLYPVSETELYPCQRQNHPCQSSKWSSASSQTELCPRVREEIYTRCESHCKCNRLKTVLFCKEGDATLAECGCGEEWVSLDIIPALRTELINKLQYERAGT